MDEASHLLEMAGARLIVVDWNSEGFDYEQMANLLWANSILACPALVLVVADSYKTDQALTLFRMGVDEYVCPSDHADKIQAVLGQLLAGSSMQASGVHSSTLERYRPVQESLPGSPRWAAAASLA
jgi:DNA-binding NarL/FixJ family response regulator